MRSVKTSLIVFGLYLMIIPGIGLMFMPGLFLDLFGISHREMFWMARMIGMMAFLLGIYEFSIGYYEAQPLYRWTVILRYFAAAFMAYLFLTSQVEIAILLFAAFDALGASWTLVTMSSGKP
jgi:hypothetical protein